MNRPRPSPPPACLFPALAVPLREIGFADPGENVRRKPRSVVRDGDPDRRFGPARLDHHRLLGETHRVLDQIAETVEGTRTARAFGRGVAALAFDRDVDAVQAMGRGGDFGQFDRARNVHLLARQIGGRGQFPQDRPAPLDRLLEETEILPEGFVGMRLAPPFRAPRARPSPAACPVRARPPQQGRRSARDAERAREPARSRPGRWRSAALPPPPDRRRASRRRR